MKELKKDLRSVVRSLKALTRETDKIAKKLDKLKKPHAAKKPKVKALTRVAKRRVSRRVTKVTAGDTVLKIIRKSSKGVDTATLRKKSGFEGRKVRDILYRLKKQGKIKSPRKGVYVKARS